MAAGSVGLISPIDGRVVTLPPGNDRFAAAVYGPIQKNLDEYIAKLPSWGYNSQPLVSDIFNEQTAPKTSITDLIQTAVAGFGIKAPAPTSLITAGNNGQFATVASFMPDSTITKVAGQ